MKKLFILLCCILFSFSLLLAGGKQYTITGRVGTFGAPAKAYFIRSLEDQFSIDSCDVKNGSFTFTGFTEYPFLAQIMFNPNGGGIHAAGGDVLTFYVDPGIVEINGVNSISNAEVSGSATNDLNRQFEKELESVRQRADQLQATYKNATADQLQSKQFTDSLNKEFAELQNVYNNTALNFILKHPKSILGVYMLQSELNVNPTNPNVETVFNQLSEEVRNSKPGKKLAAHIERYKPLSIGQTVPDFTMKDIADRTVSISDFRGKYLLLVFWSPECDHCKNEIPNLVKNYKLFKDKGFSILGVAIEAENKRQQWINIVTQNSMEWANVSDLKLWNSEILNIFKIYTIPFNYLIDPNGKIISRQLYGDDLTKVLSDIIP